MRRLYFRAMLRIDLLPWDEARAHAEPIRLTVFVKEQGVPPELEMDDRDPACVHAVAFLDGKAVGTGRLLPDAHIGRMAVLKEWRQRGVGGAILQKLMEKAKQRGDREIVLSAQVHAAPFYREHGFEAAGAVYEEAGIPHQDMRCPL
jgi:predicted GNAT family N-acyltransferase